MDYYMMFDNFQPYDEVEIYFRDLINNFINSMVDNFHPFYFNIFFTTAFITYILYRIVYKYLSYNTVFVSLPYDKQSYVSKNIAKSILLFALTLWSVPAIFYPIMLGVWNSYTMKLCAALYGSVDFMGLLVVPNLPKTTKYHHVVSTILIWSSFFITFEEINVSRILAIYALFSTYAFSVNAYLGLRFIGFYDRLRKFAKYNYILCCLMNWSIQLCIIYSHYMTGHFTFWYIIVIVLLGFIVRDDLILISWLRNNEKHKKYV